MINLIAFLFLKHFLISLKMPSVFSSPDADVLGGVGGFSLKNMITILVVPEQKQELLARGQGQTIEYARYL